MKYSHVIFDLDGTLVDSASEIHEAAAEVCREHELIIPSLDYIRSMSGSPPSLFFLDHGCIDGDVQELVNQFRSYLAAHAGDPGCVFDPVVPLLSRLKQHSIRISLATTKPTSLASTLLVRYGLESFFSHIQGTDPPMRHKPHPDILNACLEEARCGSAVMVGDTIFDVEAARNAAIDSIAVCTGAHDKDQLAKSNPTFLLRSLDEIYSIFDNLL